VTRIDFYRYAEDKLKFACRLATRAWEANNRVIVWSPDAERLAAFDRMLWTFQAIKFVPHCRLGDAVAPETPIVLTDAADGLPHHDVLLNLGDAWPPFFATFNRLLEIVATDEQDKQLARERYAFYKKREYELHVHDVEGA
jgi:DNA polymerase-3 subunit chi